MKRAAETLFTFVCLAAFAPGMADAFEIYRSENFSLDLSGYAQNQSLHTETFYFGKSFDRNQTRIRPEFNIKMGDRLTALYSHSLEMNIGSCLNTMDYEFLKDIPPQTYYDWDWELEYNDRRHVRSAIYRAYVVYEEDRVRITAGRQRVAWGTALFWNPTDLFNPVSPVSLEPMEKEGVDGLSAEFMLKSFTYLTLVYGIGDKWADSKFAGRLKTTVKSFDISVMAGKFENDHVAGADFSGYLADGSIYGEAAYTWTDDADDYLRLAVGYQYSWPNSASLAVEYYHNGNPVEFDLMALFDPDILSDGLATFGKNFIGLMAGYDLTPLVRTDVTFIFDLDKDGVFTGPHVSYIASGALTLEGGIQAFAGPPESEYSMNSNIFWLRARYYFD